MPSLALDKPLVDASWATVNDIHVSAPRPHVYLFPPYELLIPQRSLDLMWNCNSISVVLVHDSVFGPKYPIVEQFQRKLKIKITS